MRWSCVCTERVKAVAEGVWVVERYKSRRSAFDGYEVRASEYSAVRCKSCGMVWRTKAAYVEDLISGERMKSACAAAKAKGTEV